MLTAIASIYGGGFVLFFAGILYRERQKAKSNFFIDKGFPHSLILSFFAGLIWPYALGKTIYDKILGD